MTILHLALVAITIFLLVGLWYCVIRLLLTYEPSKKDLRFWLGKSSKLV